MEMAFPFTRLNSFLCDLMECVMFNEKNQYLTAENKSFKKTILLVEDDSIISELLVQMILQETPYEVFAVPDGFEALDLVQDIKPQLLILDYWLPFMQGIEVYDLLHSTEGLEEVPAIMLSVNAPVHEVNQRQLTYIRKPFDMSKLLAAINRLLV
jgi:DNA-binding response OmpR family regulator